MQVLSFGLLLGSCQSQEQKSAKALVILSGKLKGSFFKEQEAIIAFKDSQDSVYIERVVIPDFDIPAYPGDSIEVFGYPTEIKFGKLYRYSNTIYEEYEYILRENTFTKKALFNNGVLTIGTFDAKGNPLSLEYYTYQSEAEDIVKIYPIGLPNDTAFSMGGDLGEDSLSVKGYNEVYYYQAIR